MSSVSRSQFVGEWDARTISNARPGTWASTKDDGAPPHAAVVIVSVGVSLFFIVVLVAAPWYRWVWRWYRRLTK
jgi:hypothetical protein